MFITDPPATAGGTDLLQVQLLTFESMPWDCFTEHFFETRVK